MDVRSLAGETALIMGAGSGIGREIALACSIAGAREAMIANSPRRDYGPERVAKNILRAEQRERVVAPVTIEAWTAYYVKRLAPWALHALSRWQARSGFPGAP